MFIRPLIGVSFTLALAGLLGCGGGGDRGDAAQLATINIAGKFEKQSLTANGLSSTTVLPARYCFAEIRQDSDNSVLASGYLAADGTGTATVTAGTRVYVNLYPQVEVPAGAVVGDYFMHGGVKNAVQANSYASATTFNALPDWLVTSATVAVAAGGTLEVLATNSTANREAGAFNIADQAVNFALTVRAVEPTLRLPNLHLFWQPNGQATTNFPAAAMNTAGQVLTQNSTRSIFQMSVRGRAASSNLAGVDECNDGLLQQRFASMLFAPYSYPANGSAATSIIRGDGDSFGRTDRGIQSESSAAFITGFCDFFSAAVRISPTILEVDNQGVVTTVNLDSHAHASRTANQGEFYSDAIANSLYGIWKHQLGGNDTALMTLWQATLSNKPGAYLNAPLACYPTFLVGLKEALSTSQWTGVLGELALEDMGDVTAADYFGDPAVTATTPLWITVAKPTALSGALVTHTEAAGIYYDRSQAEAYRFLQTAAGPISITMTPLDGQDFFLELISPNGVLLGSYDKRPSASPRTLTSAGLTGGNLPAGTYVVRVKAGYTSAALTAARYNLTIN